MRDIVKRHQPFAASIVRDLVMTVLTTAPMRSLFCNHVAVSGISAG